jgi:2-phosphosulfolactate phosphatase
MRVTCGWGVNALRAVPSGAVIIIVDVFSFSTAVTVACARGASILPCAWSDERAAALADAEGAQLASKDRSSAFSLSPAAVRNIPSGARMVLPSRNGSTIAAAAREAAFGAIVAGCLRNAAAVARWVGGREAAVVAGGERWPDDTIRFAIEDWIAAGAIIARLSHARSPEAEAAAAAFERLRGDLSGVLRESMSGQELMAAGWSDDIAIAADLDADECVPVLEGNAFKLTRS